VTVRKSSASQRAKLPVLAVTLPFYKGLPTLLAVHRHHALLPLTFALRAAVPGGVNAIWQNVLGFLTRETRDLGIGLSDGIVSGSALSRTYRRPTIRSASVRIPADGAGKLYGRATSFTLV
jgi:hypothetical protein